ncbi:hypothetical protein GLOTRDRAFT_131663 [Gloeophyllum trabeum ATCC 11539]|uniref:Uncharacterized protein n=1 Tax=Gloeophyllum trabeum (strain ATCC 11539 / FP-39264 / Madison 617) TaxID=670483 RepID=S7PXT4_GLOTA|nr:uncharacterized protein GLOTRDRAFT_131663 [Gloeophyllum trabeum ATCC 11539]EPQ52421.1 hypothetical protein GLOTRDRAFT_131663 [Gloeophyllum trabeum ATCC 11539]
MRNTQEQNLELARIDKGPVSLLPVTTPPATHVAGALATPTARTAAVGDPKLPSDQYPHDFRAHLTCGSPTPSNTASARAHRIMQPRRSHHPPTHRAPSPASHLGAGTLQADAGEGGGARDAGRRCKATCTRQRGIEPCLARARVPIPDSNCRLSARPPPPCKWMRARVDWR